MERQTRLAPARQQVPRDQPLRRMPEDEDQACGRQAGLNRLGRTRQPEVVGGGFPDRGLAPNVAKEILVVVAPQEEVLRDSRLRVLMEDPEGRRIAFEEAANLLT